MAASSELSIPTNKFSFLFTFKSFSAFSKAPGPIFAAQPELLTIWVNLYFFVILLFLSVKNCIAIVDLMVKSLR
jgi:hypothetical protein